MKAGTENRKKTIAAGALVAGALVSLFVMFNTFFGESDTSPTTTATPTPVRANVPATSAAKSVAGSNGTAGVPGGAAPGVQAQKLASASSGLDPTLDEVAMIRTESLVYSGTGRNIFSAVYTPSAPVAKKFTPPPTPPARPAYTPPPGPPLPPPPPPINLKFFGTATRSNGARQAFLLSGDDVYLAAQGDIVARKYKIGNIGTNSVSVTDLTSNNTQTLPLQAN